MKDYYEVYEDMCEVLNKELAEANEKIRTAGGKMSAGDLDYIDKLTHAVKSIKTTMAMMDSEDGYSNAMYTNDWTGGSYARRYGRDNTHPEGSYYGGSYARGRGRNAKRDSMGRYSNEGYSRAHEGMIQELRELMEDAQDEHTRQEFQRFINKLEQR